MQATGNWKEVIDNPEVDAVVIGTWPNMHHTLVTAALRAGKHVLCEARMVSGDDRASWMLGGEIC